MVLILSIIHKYPRDYKNDPLIKSEIFISVDGVLSEWSDYYACNVTCGGGIQWRNRTCIGPFFGGANCTDPLQDSRKCNTHNCPSKCHVKENEHMNI